MDDMQTEAESGTHFLPLVVIVPSSSLGLLCGRLGWSLPLWWRLAFLAGRGFEEANQGGADHVVLQKIGGAVSLPLCNHGEEHLVSRGGWHRLLEDAAHEPDFLEGALFKAINDLGLCHHRTHGVKGVLQ